MYSLCTPCLNVYVDQLLATELRDFNPSHDVKLSQMGEH